MLLFAQLLLQHKCGPLTCPQITRHSGNLNTTSFPGRRAGLITKALKNSDSCCEACVLGFFLPLPWRPAFHRLQHGCRWCRHLAAEVAPIAHPAVLVDGPQSFHGHVSDMAPPEQDLSWKKDADVDVREENTNPDISFRIFLFFFSSPLYGLYVTPLYEQSDACKHEVEAASVSDQSAFFSTWLCPSGIPRESGKISSIIKRNNERQSVERELFKCVQQKPVCELRIVIIIINYTGSIMSWENIWPFQATHKY